MANPSPLPLKWCFGNLGYKAALHVHRLRDVGLSMPEQWVARRAAHCEPIDSVIVSVRVL